MPVLPPDHYDTDDPGASPGPTDRYQGRAGFGYGGTAALRFDVPPDPSAGVHRQLLHEVDVPIAVDTELSYVLHYDLDDELAYAASWTSLDVLLDDGRRLSEVGATDQLGFPADPDGQGRSKALYPHQWNLRRIGLGALAGARAVAVELAVRADTELALTGWVDRIRFARADDPASRRPAERVITTRGTDANGTFSRGNNVPATSWPNGFAGYTPVTDARTMRWVYSWSDHNDDHNRPVLQALAVTHQPSPWMGERQPFQLMPQAGDGMPTADPARRGLPFRHDDEQAWPHHYRVRTVDDHVAEVAPTEHAAVFRFTYPAGKGRLIFDQATADGATMITGDGEITAWTDAIPGPRGDGAGRMFVYAYADLVPTATGTLPDGAGEDTACFADFEDPDSAAPLAVTVYLATSFLSIDQARRNLVLEIGAPGAEADFATVAARAADAWDARLGVLELPGSSAEAQLTTYGNLYRLNLYPSILHENLGSNAAPVWVHASPGRPLQHPHTATATGCAVLPGRLSANHGFWDTFRTAWPAYALLYPREAAAQVDGFVQHYRDAGWIPRWSAPGFADCMVGTSSDVSFADAVLKGVDADVDAVYLSALRNASAPSADTRMGRKSLSRALFLGYTPAEEPEGLSWTLDGCVNDAAIAALARWLLAHPDRTRLDAGELAADAAWLGARSRDYRRLFHPEHRFFIGRRADGSWRTAGRFNPDDWGGDYTETNAWTAALTAPQDVAGLASLYGGRRGLADRLGEYFSRPETGDHRGAYGTIIHEMTEARDVRMGMYGHSNQPSHHIPFLWLTVGRPDRTQAVVREVMSRFHAGSEIGQGYGGDEDNGEMSAWQLFAVLGVHPFPVGSTRYAIGSPIYPAAIWHRGDGTDLEVATTGTGPYVAGVSLDGRAVAEPWLEHDQLITAHRLEFALAEEPQAWGSALDEEAAPEPMLVDVTESGDVVGEESHLALLFDDDALTDVVLPAGAVVELRRNEPVSVELATLTCGDDPGLAPSAFRLEAEVDGAWTQLAEVVADGYRWPRQTRPFVVRPVPATRHRITFTQAATVAEIQLLAPQG